MIHRCFQSRGGQAALYVEAATEPTVYKPMAEFAYDLQSLPKGKGYDPNEGKYLLYFNCHCLSISKPVVLPSGRC